MGITVIIVNMEKMAIIETVVDVKMQMAAISNPPANQSLLARW